MVKPSEDDNKLFYGRADRSNKGCSLDFRASLLSQGAITSPAHSHLPFKMIFRAIFERYALPPFLRSSRACSPSNTVPRVSYHQKVIDHYENPRNVGSLDKSSSTVGTGLVGAPACGDVMKLQIRVDPSTNRIVEARFKTFGCGSAIASSSVATEWIKGRTVEEAMNVRNQEIAKELCLPPVKLHCSMLAEDAIKSAIKDYQQKQVAEGTT